MSTSPAAEKIWSPREPSATNLDIFRRHVNQKRGLSLQDSVELQAWATNASTAADWWMDLFEYEQLQPGVTPSCSIQSDTQNMYPVPTFFPGIHMNFSEHLLTGKNHSNIAMYACTEGGFDLRSYTWAEIWDGVERIADALRSEGIQQGDRVAAIISNCVEAIMTCLAVLSIGAIWSTSSPDMGLKGIMDRLVQINPKIVILESSVMYNGKTRNLLPKYTECLRQLESLETFRFAVFIERQLRVRAALAQHNNVRIWPDFLASGTGRPLTFEQLPFNHPGFIVYSSGTTGVPKCIVHSACGLLMQIKKDYILSLDVRPHDVVFQYTTTGWIMWAMVLCGLSYGGKIVVYDGSPFQPDPLVTLRLVEKLKVTLYGTSARFLSDLRSMKVNPREKVDLSSLRTVTSTGSVLGSDVCKWFYDNGFPKAVHLVSCSGGTDMACSLTGDPTRSVHAGEIQGPALGMAVSVYDPISAAPGISIASTNIPGELVCMRPFPSQPVKFWNNNDGTKYRASYFERFGDGVWCQGDFVRRNVHTGGYEMLGRSDGVLNPSGVRFGSSEIYEALAASPGPDPAFPFADTLAIGQRRPTDADETVLLFIKLLPRHTLTPALITRIRSTIQSALSPRHVPKHIFAVPDIPYTINGKKIEIAVKQVVSGVQVLPSGAVMNPEALKYFERFVRLEEEVRKAEGGDRAKL